MLSSLRNTADNRELDAINKVRSSFYLNTLQGDTSNLLLKMDHCASYIQAVNAPRTPAASVC
jgi:hypothetical protein